jgi:hypothetical protein
MASGRSPSHGASFRECMSLSGHCPPRKVRIVSRLSIEFKHNARPGHFRSVRAGDSGDHGLFWPDEELLICQ